MRSLVIAALGVGCSATPADEAITVAPGPGCTGALGEVLVPPAPQIVPIEHVAEPLAVPTARPFVTPPQQIAPPTSVTVGMPWGSISALAATEDETAVVSLDASGGLRIWPTLDGRHEPIVVGATGHTQQLSIEHADDIVVARLDNTGTAEIIRVAVTGAPLGRFTVASERPLVSVKAVDTGALALRDDGALVGINLIGEVIGTILPDPGQRIITLVTRSHRALAMLSSQEGIVARWIELLPFRWGPTSPRLGKIDPATTALAPDHRSIATTNTGHTKVLVINLATGKVIAKPVDIAGDDGFNHADVIGFLDDGTLALRHDGTVAWWRDQEHELVDNPLGFGAVTITGRHLLGAIQTQLMITSPYETRYLGYRLINPSHFLPTKGGLLIGGRRSVLRIDHELDVQVSYQLDSHLSDFIPIDAHHVIATHDDNEIESVDLDDPDSAKHIDTAYNGMIAYEPATHLLAIPQHGNMEFVRFDPKTGTFDEPTLLELPEDEDQGSMSVELFDPSAANGIAALIVFRAFEFEGQPRGIRAVAVKSARRGRTPDASKRRSLTADEMRRFDAGDRSMFGIEVTTRHKSPDGAYVAELGNGRLTLRRSSGEQLWKLPAAGIEDLAWSSEGRLLAFGGGVAELDLTTGAYLDRRCGWEFGLWNEPSDEVGSGAELCKLK